MHHLQPKKTHQHPDEAYNQFIELPNILDDSTVSGEGDIWFTFGVRYKYYSCSKAYKVMKVHRQVYQAFI